MKAASAALQAGWQIREADLRPLGDGHINDTLLATLADGRRFVLQRINQTVFTRPDRVMSNLARVQNHLRERAPELTPALIPTAGGEPAWMDSADDWWRLWEFVPDGRSLNRSRDPQICRAAGSAFGRFQRLLADLPGPALEPTIPGFLELGGYLVEFDEIAGRVPEAAQAIADACGDESLIDEYRYLADRFPRGDDLIHADCKLNNLLFEATGPRVRAVLDLDTIMVGHWAWDFGDLARSVLMGANWGADCGEASRNGVDAGGDPRSLFGALCEGFALSAERDFEPSALAEAPTYIAFMLGIRFLTDHLAGDRYFKVSERGENARRAREQFDLVQNLSGLGLSETAADALARVH